MPVQHSTNKSAACLPPGARSSSALGLETDVTPSSKFGVDGRTGIRTALASVALALALTGFGAHAAWSQATTGQPVIGQPAPPLNPLTGIEVLVTPYFWMPWTSVGINPSNTRIPSTSGTIDFGTLFTHQKIASQDDRYFFLRLAFAPSEIRRLVLCVVL